MFSRSLLFASTFLALACATNSSTTDTARSDALVPDAPTPMADAGLPPPEWAACDPEELPAGYVVPPDVQCAFLEVPIDRAAPASGSLALRVAIHRARRPSGRAIFQLAGGPGGSAVAQAGIIPRVLPRLRDTFDLVYVDQRRTGGSGYLDCPSGYPENAQEWQRCARTVAAPERAHDLTRDAADDLDVVRRWLGYDRILLRGGSYGTRVALEYARRHGDRIVAMALDGAVPPDFDFFSETIGKVDLGMSLLFADCAADAACARMAPSLRTEAEALVASAAASPRTITVGGTPVPEDGRLVRVQLGSFVEAAYYRFKLPRAIHEASRGNWARWDALASDLFGAVVIHDTRGDGALERALGRRVDLDRSLRAQGSYVAPGLYLTVLCAEDFPSAPSLADLRALAARQSWGLGSVVDVAAACPTLGVPPIDTSLRSPVRSDVPTLVISGAIDIQTPPASGAHVAESLGRARHVVVPDATHSAMTTPCGGQIIEDFLLSEGNFAALDLSCLGTYDVPFDT